MTYGTALQCLSDPTRRRVFERLRSGPHSVGVLAAGLPVSRPAVSQHLKALKAAGLVIDRCEGTRRVYYIDPDGLGERVAGVLARDHGDGWRDLIRTNGDAWLGVGGDTVAATSDM